MKKIGSALLVLVAAAGLLGAATTSAAADESPCLDPTYGCDSHWMDRGRK